ncbi:MAG: hypothetical protein GXO97_07090 [Nitrospirae bacterium]|nr:hypothetical protein [Nitrospirota bacterium]
MRWRGLIRGVFLIVLAATLLFPTLGRASDDAEKKAVYHCDFGNPKRVDAMLRNIYNLVNYYTTNGIPYDVRVVSNSACVQFLLTDTKGTRFASKKVPPRLAKSINERMQSLVDGYDVKFEQCSITLKRTNTPKSKLKPFVSLVNSGQVRVVELQEKGYAYIKVK